MGGKRGVCTESSALVFLSRTLQVNHTSLTLQPNIHSFVPFHAVHNSHHTTVASCRHRKAA